MMTVEFQEVVKHASGFKTVSLGAYDEVAVLPTAGMKVKLILSGADAPYVDGKIAQGIVSASMPATLYVPNQGIDAMIYLENVTTK